jgi:glycosyltransferase involved in cell wall biosynthesis
MEAGDTNVVPKWIEPTDELDHLPLCPTRVKCGHDDRYANSGCAHVPRLSKSRAFCCWAAACPLHRGARVFPRPLRVAIVAPSPRILGGQSVQAKRLIDGWRDDPAVEAWLVPINPEPPAPLVRLLETKYVRTVMTQLWYWPRLVRELREADIVHVFSASYLSFLLAPLPAVGVARVWRKPVVLNYHSGEAPDHLRRSALARKVLRSVDVNIVPSSFLQDVFRDAGLEAGVVPNVAEPGRFTYRERRPLRPRLLSTRNFAPLYNVACTLRAFARVQARYPDASLTVVGRGSQELVLQSLARQLRLRNVTFTGAVPQEQIHRFYDDADIYVQTPSIDNMPLSLIEAFASGLPAVATDVGGVPAILQHRVHGLLAADDDDEGIAEQVMWLLAHHDEARRMADAAHATCRAYEWSVVRAQWLEVYQSLVPHAQTCEREAA